MFGFLPILLPFYALLLPYLLWGSHVMKTDYICIHPIPFPILLCFVLASKSRRLSTLSHSTRHTSHDDNSHCLHPDSTHWSHASRPLYAPQRNLMPVTCVSSYESRLASFRSLSLSTSPNVRTTISRPMYLLRFLLLTSIHITTTSPRSSIHPFNLSDLLRPVAYL